jgi:hypothetical protein
MEKFKLALTVIPGDDFLMGRKPPRPGEKPFKLNLDRLLRTSDTMGDVLAGLVDCALDDSDPKRTPNKAASQYRVPGGSPTSYYNFDDGVDR